jgi:hypothetical protein
MLTRWIPENVRREVRKRSGFGCVHCGVALLEYAHFDPVFAKATEHRAEGITVLCPTCHSKVDKGIISQSSLLKDVAEPHALQVGYSRDKLEVGNSPTVVLCDSTIIGSPVIIEVSGRTLLGVSQPELSGAPFGLSASFYDKVGNPIAEIVANEWQPSVGNWDVKSVGTRITVRYAPGDIALAFRTESPSTIVIERIDMYYKGFHLVGQEGKSLKAYNDVCAYEWKNTKFYGNAKAIVF